MSDKKNVKQVLSDFGSFGSHIVFEAIKKHAVHYTNASDDKNIKHSYSIDCPEVYISTLKVADRNKKLSAKYMLNITFKEFDFKASDSADFAKKIYSDLRAKYESAMKRTRLTRRFQNPSFTSPKIRG